MGNFNWEKVETIIDEVLQLPEDQRETYIEKRCGADEQTKTEVIQLLHSIQESEGWLEGPDHFKN